MMIMALYRFLQLHCVRSSLPLPKGHLSTEISPAARAVCACLRTCTYTRAHVQSLFREN